jgi:penicillin-binding protein 2
MVSMPTFTREQVENDTKWVFGDPVDFPYVNRPIAMPYMPGSPVKPIVLTSAVTAGVHRLDHGITCNGHLVPGYTSGFRCWIYQAPWHSTHDAQFGHPLSGDDAICVSCNIYFYTLGESLGIDGCKEWFGKFGVGRGFNLGIGAEFPGIVGQRMDAEPLYRGDARFMGIGQGPILWTPLHAADAYATLVRGGQRLVPRIVKGQTIVAEDLLLDPEAVSVALKGLHRALHDRMGSGHGQINVPGVSTWGKTGTAESARIFGEDPDGEGPEPRPILREGDHAWFVLLVGREGGMPRYAIAVVMEYAGSGGKVSGPIAEQIVWALRAEGYL